MIIHLNGMAGVGKLTVAKILQEKLDARLVDNHVVIDLVRSCVERGPKYAPMLEKIMQLVLEQLSSETEKKFFIFTNALVNESASDVARFNRISKFALEMQMPFVQILLECSLDENKKRIISEDRKLKRKLTNIEVLDELMQKYTMYHPDTEYRLTIDTTNITPDQTAQEIMRYISSVK